MGAEQKYPAGEPLGARRGEERRGKPRRTGRRWAAMESPMKRRDTDRRRSGGHGGEERNPLAKPAGTLIAGLLGGDDAVDFVAAGGHEIVGDGDGTLVVRC